MQIPIMYYEWIVWFKDGNVIAQHESDGTEILWQKVIDHHKISPVQRVGWVPFTPRRARDASALYKKQYDEAFEKKFPISYQQQIDDFVVPVKPKIDDKAIKYNEEKLEKFLKLYEEARKEPYNETEWRALTYMWRDNCVARPIASHFVETQNGELPLITRRLEWGWRGRDQLKRYFYIMGSSGRKVKDDNGKIHYVDGYYQAIDGNGHTRLCHYSNVPVPILPPEFADKHALEVNEIAED